MVCVFARQTSEPLTSLVKKIDAEIAKNGKLKSFVVILTDDADKTADALQKIAASSQIKNVPLTVIESPAGPPQYKIAEGADVTVLLWNRTQVKANHAFADGSKMSDKDIDAVLADLPKILN